jgi:hypothetical protein
VRGRGKRRIFCEKPDCKNPCATSLTLLTPGIGYLYTAKKAHGIIVCRGSISMYREEISTAWKGQKNSIHLWKYSLQYKLQFPYPLLPLPSNEFHRSME